MRQFKYIQPKNIKDAQSKLLKEKTALPYAGGTDILGLLKDDIISPNELVNLKKLGLDKIIFTDKELKISAAVTITEIADNQNIKKSVPILAQAAREVASPQLRNVGTIAGNICQRPRCWYFRGEFDCLRKGGDTCYAYQGQNKYHCVTGGSPCFIVHPSDMAVALSALDARLSIYSKGKSKVVSIKDFFVDPSKDYTKENILEQGEIIEEIIIPLIKTEAKSTFIKFKERDVWDFAVVSIGAVIEKSGNKITKASIAFGGIAPVPWIDQSLNKALLSITPDEKSIDEVTGTFLKDAEPLEMNEYKIPLVRNLLKRILLER